MPIFDQPDIKAVVEFTIRAFKHWVVLGNSNKTSEVEVEGEGEKDFKDVLFNPTPKIST